jgi:hypothetical protein
MEKIGSDSVLTALVLREGARPGDLKELPLKPQSWKGRWALISQDDKDIFSSSLLALIPFDPGELVIPWPVRPAAVTRLGLAGETQYDRWEWSNGYLKVDMPEEILEKTAGLLIHKDNQKIKP